MVRLEIDYEIKYKYKDNKIYIPVWLDQKCSRNSSIVAFSIIFTFQYGQIRNLVPARAFLSIHFIYIPVWLDQK